MKAYIATGRRKTSVAQIRLLPGNGTLTVNKKPVNEYFPVEVTRSSAFRPLDVTQKAGMFDVSVNVRGGGPTGQAGAISLAIARALVEFDEELRGKLRTFGMLTRDPRMVERKKYGQKKARKRFQFSKR